MRAHGASHARLDDSVVLSLSLSVSLPLCLPPCLSLPLPLSLCSLHVLR